MSVAFELEYEAFRPRLYALPSQPPQMGTSPRVRRRRIVLAAIVVTLLVLLALPLRVLGGSTVGPPAAAAPMAGQSYVVQAGDTLASIAARVDHSAATSLTSELTQEVGSSVVVPGEHIFIP